MAPLIRHFKYSVVQTSGSDKIRVCFAGFNRCDVYSCSDEGLWQIDQKRLNRRCSPFNGCIRTYLYIYMVRVDHTYLWDPRTESRNATCSFSIATLLHNCHLFKCVRLIDCFDMMDTESSAVSWFPADLTLSNMIESTTCRSFERTRAQMLKGRMPEISDIYYNRGVTYLLEAIIVLYRYPQNGRQAKGKFDKPLSVIVHHTPTFHTFCSSLHALKQPWTKEAS